MSRSTVCAMAVLAFVAAASAAYAQQSKAGDAAFDELMKCRDRYPTGPTTLFWRCAKDVLRLSKIEPRRVSEAIMFGDYAVDLHLKGQSTEKQLDKQLADILAKATD